MKRIFTALALLVFLFSTPAASGEDTFEDLVVTDGLFYREYTDTPFAGKVTGKIQGSIRNGKREGVWASYYENGQLEDKGTILIRCISNRSQVNVHNH